MSAILVTLLGVVLSLLLIQSKSPYGSGASSRSSSSDPSDIFWPGVATLFLVLPTGPICKGPYRQWQKGSLEGATLHRTACMLSYQEGRSATEVLSYGRALPTLINSYRNFIEVQLPQAAHLKRCMQALTELSACWGMLHQPSIFLAMACE